MIKVKVVDRSEVTVSIRVSYSSKVRVRFPIRSASLSLRHRACYRVRSSNNIIYYRRIIIIFTNYNVIFHY